MTLSYAKPNSTARSVQALNISITLSYIKYSFFFFAYNKYIYVHNSDRHLKPAQARSAVFKLRLQLKLCMLLLTKLK